VRHSAPPWKLLVRVGVSGEILEWCVGRGRSLGDGLGGSAPLPAQQFPVFVRLGDLECTVGPLVCPPISGTN